MRSVAQRVRSASVEVAGEIVGRVGGDGRAGLLVYLGAGEGDGEKDVRWMVSKLVGLRIFEDDHGKMGRSVVDVGGSILCVPQFTLYADVRRGLRPSFDGAATPDRALALYEQVTTELCARGVHVETGRFRTTMIVRAEVLGPVTIHLDSRSNPHHPASEPG